MSKVQRRFWTQIESMTERLFNTFMERGEVPASFIAEVERDRDDELILFGVVSMYAAMLLGDLPVVTGGVFGCQLRVRAPGSEGPAEPLDIDQAPLVYRTLGRFIAAVANRDWETARSLYRACEARAELLTALLRINPPFFEEGQTTR